jgi:glycosyltransferase involved in cell wall biosynthesis
MSLPDGRVPDVSNGSAQPSGGPSFTKLSIFYPMWNEQEYAARALEFGTRTCEELVAAGEIGSYELIVVDDASTDRTPQIVDEIARRDPHVTVVRHRVNRKLGGAMKTGFAAATGDLILYTDADLPFDMSELSRALRLMREYSADIVSAYRFDRTGEGSIRTIYTIVYNALIKALFGVRVRDINFAFKLCRASIFDHIELRSEGSFIDAELVVRASRLGLVILQFGVDYFPRTRGESTLSRPSVIFKIIREMWLLRRDLGGIAPLDRT